MRPAALPQVVPAPPGVLTDAAPNVIVEYEVVPTTSPSAVGDRGIFGLDGQYRFGKNTNLTMHFAHSGGASDRTGNALSIRGTTTLGSLTLGLNFRDVGRNFSAIESVGFQQKERALEGSRVYAGGSPAFPAASAPRCARPAPVTTATTAAAPADPRRHLMRRRYRGGYPCPPEQLRRLDELSQVADGRPHHQRYHTSGRRSTLGRQ